jgi:PKHD-type hydroxylase
MNRPTKKKQSNSILDTNTGAWPLYLDHVENWAWKKSVFSDDELDEIIRLGNSLNLDEATTIGNTNTKKIRNSSVRFLFPNESSSWIFAKLTDAVNQINEQFFKFDLTGFEQGLQFTRYSAPDQHYEWHLDRDYMTPTRKLSLSVQLSDPKDYKGGQLQLKYGRTDTTIKCERGLISFFPSYTLHRVKPVTEGTRYSLVAWISGPPFK